jgi:deoxyribodipyrimidine photo-lyase
VEAAGVARPSSTSCCGATSTPISSITGLLYHRPELAWFELEDDREGLAAWQEGRTGYPLVDAGMRQLTGQGWVHNRARMVVASFLTKHLLVDWREDPQPRLSRFQEASARRR